MAITVGALSMRGLEGRCRAGGTNLVVACGIALLATACSSDSSGDGESTPAILTVRSDTVEVNNSAVAPATTRNVEPGDHVQATDGGSGTLRLPELVELELFKGSNVLVPDPGSEPQSEVTVDLESGHLLVSADPDSGAEVELRTGNRTLRTVEDGTSYIVCQAPEGNTCLFVIDGAVEWSDPMGVRRYETGEGTFAGPDQGPQAARCDEEDTVDLWLAQARANQTDENLAAQVARLLEGECGPPPTTTTGGETTTTSVDAEPSGVGMVLVSIEEPVVGTDDFEANPDNYRELVPIDGPIVFHVDELVVTNGDFRDWVIEVAQNDPEEWKRIVPASWLDGVEGVETHASYPSGEDETAVVGARWETAAEYCGGIGKHLVTEIEWELAAVNGHLRDLEAGRQDWVAEPGDYGDEPPEGQRMTRGNDNTTQRDPYYRLSLVDTAESTAARAGARIRCAASEVQAGPVPGGGLANDEYRDDFTSLDGGWPKDEDETFALGYHLPDAYHLEPHQPHARGAVVRNTSDSLADVHIQAGIFIVRSRMGEVEGNYRFGVTAGSPNTGFLLFTVQPDEASGGRHDWCLSMMDDRLTTMLADANRAWYQAPLLPESHEGEFCAGGLNSGSIEVADIDDPVVMSIEISADDVVVTLNGREVRTPGISIPVDAYGFFAQTYAKNKVHIHFDDIDVTVP